MPALVLIAILGVGVVLAVGLSALRGIRRVARKREERDAATDALLHRYAEGGFHKPVEELVEGGEATLDRGAGWHAKSDVSRLYMPTTGLNIRNREITPLGTESGGAPPEDEPPAQPPAKA